jgi:hypothetical protein
MLAGRIQVRWRLSVLFGKALLGGTRLRFGGRTFAPRLAAKLILRFNVLMYLTLQGSCRMA